MKKVLLLGDVHAPYHHKSSWNLMMRAAGKWKPDIVVQMGDFLDGYPVSRYAKNPLRPQLIDDEIKVGNQLLDQLDSLGAKEKHLVMGNHDQRLADYVQNNAPALTNIVRFEDLLHLKSRGWKVTSYRDHLKLGKLYLTHDTGSAGRTANLKALDAYQGNVGIGHVHRLSVTYESNIKGESHMGLSVGWLGDAKSADYMNKVGKRYWATGFATAILRPDGVVHTRLHPIVKKSVELDGVIYR